MAASSRQWKRVRTLGRGASGAEVFLAADDASGELFAVKSAGAAAATLRREQEIMAGLRSPNVLSCIGGRGGHDGSYQLFLEFAPGGSLADAVRSGAGGRLEERAVRAYAADVAAGLAYVHGVGLVHGDVKPRNVVIGGDGRAKLADFGCSRKADSRGPILGGTPAFMAPEVARGEEQGPAADVWALGCTVVEMATGLAPWNGSGMDDGDVLAALHRIGYTDAVPEVPKSLSADAKDFLARCLTRRPSDRCTAAQLLEHPFLSAAGGVEEKREWVSPKSTLDAAFWETDGSEEEDDDAEVSAAAAHSTAERIRALACPASSLPEDWDSDEGWIDVMNSTPSEASEAASAPVSAEETTEPEDGGVRSQGSSAETSLGLGITVDSSDAGRDDAGEAENDSIGHSRIPQSLEISVCADEAVPCKLLCHINNSMDSALPQNFLRPLSLVACVSAARKSRELEKKNKLPVVKLKIKKSRVVSFFSFPATPRAEASSTAEKDDGVDAESAASEGAWIRKRITRENHTSSTTSMRSKKKVLPRARGQKGPRWLGLRRSGGQTRSRTSEPAIKKHSLLASKRRVLVPARGCFVRWRSIDAVSRVRIHVSSLGLCMLCVRWMDGWMPPGLGIHSSSALRFDLDGGVSVRDKQSGYDPAHPTQHSYEQPC